MFKGSGADPTSHNYSAIKQEQKPIFQFFPPLVEILPASPVPSAPSSNHVNFKDLVATWRQFCKTRGHKTNLISFGRDTTNILWVLCLQGEGEWNGLAWKTRREREVQKAGRT